MVSSTGQRIGITWTFLASTAQAGDITIDLLEEVEWYVGDEIVIATTGLRHSQIETETRTITGISGSTLTLDEALVYKHLGETVTYGSDTLEARAEVGLLTHNVVVRGYNDPQWNDVIEKCEAGFDTGWYCAYLRSNLEIKCKSRFEQDNYISYTITVPGIVILSQVLLSLNLRLKCVVSRRVRHPDMFPRTFRRGDRL